MRLTEPTIAIREIDRLKVVPWFAADYPPVDVLIEMCVALAATATRREAARGVSTAAAPDVLLGSRTFGADVELTAAGAAAGRGYDLEPKSARLVSWWGTVP